MLNEMAKEIHENAVAHGWWEEERKLPEILMLCVSELSEALEEYRAGRPMEWYVCLAPIETWIVCTERGEHGKICSKPCAFAGDKMEGIAVEMADCIIRILDWCGKEGIDIDDVVERKMAHNATRPYKHGNEVC